MQKIIRHSFDLVKSNEKHLPTFIEGHRGVNREMPENTIKSFSKAIEYGLNSVELDIWLTKDKVPVVIHGGDDGEIDKFVDGKGNVKNFDLKKLKTFKTKQGAQQIPTLEEVLKLCKGKIFINIELKDPNIKETFDLVMKAVEKYDMTNEIAISSFKHKYYECIVEYSKKKKPIEFGFLYEDTKDPKKSTPFKWDVKNVSFNIYQKDATPELCKKIHDTGNGVMAGFKMKDAEDDKLYEKLITAGVNTICCNEPKKAKAFRDKYFANKK